MDFLQIKQLQEAFTANRIARLDADVEALELTLHRTCHGPALDAALTIVKRLATAARCHLQDDQLQARDMRKIVLVEGTPADD